MLGMTLRSRIVFSACRYQMPYRHCWLSL